MASDVNYLNLLDNPIAFHRVYAQIGGGAGAGVFISQLVYWHRQMTTAKGEEWDGWFYKTAEQWEFETCTTRRERQNAEKILTDLNVLEIKKKGIPAKKHYRVNESVLNDLVSQFVRCDKLVETPPEPSNDDSLSDVTNKNARSDKQECQNEQTGLSDMASKSETSDKQACHISQCNTENTQRLPETNSETSCASEGSDDASGKKSNPPGEVWQGTKGNKISGKHLEIFKQLWDAYEHKKSKASAITAYLKTIKPMFGKDKSENRAIVDNLLESIKLHVRSRQTRPDQTVLYFEGWINQRRWEDEYPDLHKPSEAAAAPVVEKWKELGYSSEEDFTKYEDTKNYWKTLKGESNPTEHVKAQINACETVMREINARKVA